MAAPVVEWRTQDEVSQVTNWNIGVVDAGTTSANTTFNIWNNRSGSTPVSDMTNCTITTKDNAGGDTGELVTNTWIRVRVDSDGEATFSPIGGTTTRPVKAAGAAAGTISGAINDGEITDTANFAQVTLQAQVPPTATAGNINFLTRISYQYV